MCNENITIDIIKNNKKIFDGYTIGINNPNLTFDMIKKYNVDDYSQGEYPFSWNINATLDIVVTNPNLWWHYESILSNYNIKISHDFINKHSNILFNEKGYFRYLLSNPSLSIDDIELHLPITILNKYYTNVYDDTIEYINNESYQYENKSPIFVYIDSLLLNPNISMYDIKKYIIYNTYTNIKYHITSLLKNKFCYHEYYKKKLVEKFIYYNKSNIKKNLWG